MKSICERQDNDDVDASDMVRMFMPWTLWWLLTACGAYIWCKYTLALVTEFCNCWAIFDLAGVYGLRLRRFGLASDMDYSYYSPSGVILPYVRSVLCHKVKEIQGCHTQFWPVVQPCTVDLCQPAKNIKQVGGYADIIRCLIVWHTAISFTLWHTGGQSLQNYVG